MTWRGYELAARVVVDTMADAGLVGDPTGGTPTIERLLVSLGWSDLAAGEPAGH
ncbi:MAG: hypothetical protein M5R36_05395 [Deltaproteobacteria bacterium]|nr:hypothetical protein [Deltaproteobacteria bacterium]